MLDPTYGVNVHQSVEGMVKEYENKQHWEEKKYEDSDEPVLPKEQMEPTAEAQRLVAQGKLNPETGYEIPRTAKASRLTRWNPSEKFKNNFDLICWN